MKPARVQQNRLFLSTTTLSEAIGPAVAVSEAERAAVQRGAEETTRISVGRLALERHLGFDGDRAAQELSTEGDVVVAARLHAAAGGHGFRRVERSAAPLEAVRGRDDADIREGREAGCAVLVGVSEPSAVLELGPWVRVGDTGRSGFRVVD